MSDIHLEKYRSEIEYKYTFENVIETLQNEREMCSDEFWVGQLPWVLDIQLIKKRHQSVAIGCYLLGEAFFPGVSCQVSYTITALRTKQPQEFQRISNKTFTCHESYYGWKKFLLWDQLIDPAEGFLVNNALTIQVKMKTEFPQGIIDLQDPAEKLIHSLQPSITKGLIKDMGDLLESGDGDVTFKMGDGAIIKAHKSILCARNAVFAAMLSTDMKECMTKEVVIDDMGKGALKILLLHIYSGQLSLPEGLDIESCKEVVNAAEKYNLPELKEVAGMVLAKLAVNTPQNAVEHYKFLKRSNVDVATKALASFIKRNTEEILAKC